MQSMSSRGDQILVPANRHRNSHEGYALIGDCTYIAPFTQNELPPPQQTSSNYLGAGRGPYYNQLQSSSIIGGQQQQQQQQRQHFRSSKSLNTLNQSRDFTTTTTDNTQAISIVSTNLNSIGGSHELIDKKCNHNFSGAAPNIKFDDSAVDSQMGNKGKAMPHLLNVEFNTENINRVTYFVMSCLVTTFINPLFGLMAIFLSLKSHNLLALRTHESKVKASFYGRLAFFVNVLGILSTMISLIIVFIHIGDTEDFIKEQMNSEVSSTPNSIDKFSTSKPKTLKYKT